MKENTRLKAKIRKHEKRLIKYFRALYFYANPETYIATSLWCDRPCGEIENDFSYTGEDWGERLGKRARKALNFKCEKDNKEEKDQYDI